MNDLRFKVIFLGDAGVGKTSVIRQRMGVPFNYMMKPTIGTNYEMTEVQLRGELIRLRIWDTAGQEQFQSVVPMYMRGSHVAVVVASAADPASVDAIDGWIALVQENEPSCHTVVAVNKVDLLGDIDKLNELHCALYKRHRCVCLVSAKTGSGIDDLFATVADIAHNAYSGDATEAVGLTPRNGCC